LNPIPDKGNKRKIKKQIINILNFQPAKKARETRETPLFLASRSGKHLCRSF